MEEIKSVFIKCFEKRLMSIYRQSLVAQVDPERPY